MNIYIQLTILFLLLLFPIYNVSANTYTSAFDAGSSQYFSDSTITGYADSQDYSFEFWFKLDTLPSTYGTGYFIFYNRDANGGFTFNIDTNDNLVVSFYDTGLQSKFTASNIITAGELNTWIHLALSFDISQPRLYLWKNANNLPVTTNKSFATDVQGMDSIYIGATSVPNSYFDGWLDEFRTWTHLLSTSTISTYKDCGLDGDETNLESLWEFENNGNDSTSNANHLTNNNSVTYQTASLPFSNDCAGVSETYTTAEDTLSKDITIITGHKHFLTSSTSTEPYAFENTKIHIPFFGILALSIIILFIGSRLLTEFLIRWRL